MVAIERFGAVHGDNLSCDMATALEFAELEIREKELTQRTESLKLKQTPKNERNQSEEVSQAIAASLTASDEHGIPTPMFQCGGACR